MEKECKIAFGVIKTDKTKASIQMQTVAEKEIGSNSIEKNELSR